MKTFKPAIILLFLMMFVLAAFGRDEKRQLQAIRTSASIKIDGIMDESIWSSVPVATNFLTYSPTMGVPAAQNTDVRVIYDNHAIYISAVMYESSPDSILVEYTKRDNTSNANTDKFKISLNPYNDGQNIYEFEISSANVQSDLKKSVSDSQVGSYMGHGDYSWNAVWESAVKINDNGWIVEVKIPYGSLRFPKEADQTWGVNFWRTIRRSRETSSWNPVDRSFAEADQDGELVGISEIKAPLRLELYPFAAGYYELNPDGNGRSYAAGMDLKYGINEAYTLDMTLIPDFGQRKSDDIVLNLTPYEVKYRENRQFFTEGLELFDKSGLFYSRRIGKQPEKYWDVYDIVDETVESLDNPSEVKLINATKVSGRSSSNLGLGFFNAMTANTYARYKNPEMEEQKFLTDPFTNFNMLVLDQIIGRNSFVNVANTNVYTPSKSWTANVTGVTFKFSDKNNMYGFSGNMSYSTVTDTIALTPQTGYKVKVGGGKYGGNVLATYDLSLISDEYNPNHMGYLAHNNAINHDVSLSYRVLQPFSIFYNMSHSLRIEYDQLFAPREYSRFGTSLSTMFLFNNYWDMRTSLKSNPFKTHDWYEPRVDGRFFERPAYSEFNIGGSTDYRKKLAINLGYQYLWNAEDERAWEISAGPRIRVSDKLSVNPSIKFEQIENQIGYASYINADNIVFGNRSINRVTSQLSSTYVFNNKSALSLSFRHYWSAVDYNQYFLLQEDGGVEDYPEYEGNHDINFNIFTIDFEYSWNLAPGSFLTAVWKNNIYNSDKVENNYFTNYWDNFNQTLNSPQTNSFSIKLTYYVDYQQVIRPRLPFPQ